MDSTVFNPHRHWRRVQELVCQFWHRWLREWLPSLKARKKWFREQGNFQEGDVVIVMSPDTPSGRWPLGRITKVYPGQGWKVRVVDVQVGKSVTRRPAVTLCPLEHCDWDMDLRFISETMEVYIVKNCIQLNFYMQVFVSLSFALLIVDCHIKEGRMFRRTRNYFYHTQCRTRSSTRFPSAMFFC